MMVVIGGGPAGFFAAITARENRPDIPVVLLEKHKDVLRKVRISGGGRCNVTHDLEDVRALAGHYPRGQRELMGPLHRFGPANTVAWFARHGVKLKTEDDGRMFPVTDDSGTIVNALKNAAQQAGVDVQTKCGVAALEIDGGTFTIGLDDGSFRKAEQVLIATGGSTSGSGGTGFRLAAGLGHTLEEPVPSLFSFKVHHPLLEGLGGTAFVATLKAGKDLQETGPVLITHWGLSGPAALRLSAWGAREWAAREYRFPLTVDFCPGMTLDNLNHLLVEWAESQGRKQVTRRPEIGLPRRLWEAIRQHLGIPRERRWAELGKKNRQRLVHVLKALELPVSGKSLNKEEFVTCGGVRLKEVNFKTMESRLVPGLFFAGEVLDVDGLTGGFNFQNCWTTGKLAGEGMSS